MRISGWTGLSTNHLWDVWRADFESDDAAIATAVWQANKMVKSAARLTRRKFYSIKDEFIRRYGRIGQQARLDQYDCFRCEGEGWCDYCEGTGVYREAWLYLHEFEVAGQTYRLHSYVEPKTLVGSIDGLPHQGAYGAQFTDEEIANLPLPLSGLVKMLSYVAAAMWTMQLLDGRYEPAAAAPRPPQRNTVDVRHFWVGASAGG